MKKVLCLLLCVLVLGGCGSTSTSTNKYSYTPSRTTTKATSFKLDGYTISYGTYKENDEFENTEITLNNDNTYSWKRDGIIETGTFAIKKVDFSLDTVPAYHDAIVGTSNNGGKGLTLMATGNNTISDGYLLSYVYTK